MWKKFAFNVLNRSRTFTEGNLKGSSNSTRHEMLISKGWLTQPDLIRKNGLFLQKKRFWTKNNNAMLVCLHFFFCPKKVHFSQILKKILKYQPSVCIFCFRSKKSAFFPDFKKNFENASSFFFFFWAKKWFFKFAFFFQSKKMQFPQISKKFWKMPALSLHFFFRSEKSAFSQIIKKILKNVNSFFQ